MDISMNAAERTPKGYVGGVTELAFRGVARQSVGLHIQDFSLRLRSALLEHLKRIVSVDYPMFSHD